MQYEIWTVNEVADYLRCSTRHVTEMARRGNIPGFRCGTIWRFRRETILALV